MPHTHTHMLCDTLLPHLSPGSKVGRVDTMMECLLEPNQYLITGVDPEERESFQIL